MDEGGGYCFQEGEETGMPRKGRYLKSSASGAGVAG